MTEEFLKLLFNKSVLMIDREGPTFYDIFFFYSLFKSAIIVQNINETYNPHEKNIDLK